MKRKYSGGHGHHVAQPLVIRIIYLFVYYLKEKDR